MRAGVTVLCRLTLVLLHTLTAVAVGLGYVFQPAHRFDQEMLDAAGLCAMLGGAAALVTALLTGPAVALAGLRRRWYAPPAVLLTAAVVRYAYLDVAYDAW